MGTIAQKGAYLNDTKSELKQAINNLGGSITDETTFRQYVDQLDGVYDVLPKTSFQEGTSVTIEGGLKGKIDFDDGKVGFGQASQESTQGNQMYCLPPSKTLNGITYINNGDGTCDIVGTATANVDFALATRIPIAESPLVLGESYNISVLEALPDVTFQVVEYASNGTWIATTGLVRNTQSQNITIPNNSNTAFIDYNIRVYSGATVNAKGIKLMMNTGTSRKDFEKYTGGYASPSPNWEQEVKCVRGKNLAHIEVEGKYRQYNSGNLVPNSDFNSYIASVQPNTTYITNCKNIASQYPQISNLCFFNSQMQYLSGLTYNTNDKVFTTPNNCYYVTMAVDVSLEEIQTEEGTQATPYLPYNTIQETIRGKNVFDKNNITFYASNNSDFNGVDASNKIRERTNSIAIASVGIKTNTTYKISGLPNGWTLLGLGTYTQENGTNTSQATTNNNTFIINDSNVKYIFYLFGNNNSTEVATDLFNNANIQVEQGSTATSYEPYVTPRTYQFSLGNNKLYEDCYIVGSPDNWKIVSNWYRLTSAELTNLTIGASGSDGKKFVVVKSNFVGVPAPKPGKIYCTHLRYNSSAWYADGYCGIVTPGATLWMQMTQAFESVDAFKTFITTNNMEIVYQTEEPIETPITDTTLIEQLNNWYYSQSYTGTTIIESNGDLPMIIKVRALKGE